MWSWLETLSPIQQALIATGFTWGITALGATTVFVTREVNPGLLDASYLIRAVRHHSLTNCPDQRECPGIQKDSLLRFLFE